MKKYIIKDSLGNKKVIYAENIDHAIRLLNDSKITDAIDIEHYADYCWTISDGQLIRDLIDEGLDEGLSFNDVVRNHDKATSSILAKVKSYIDKSKKNLLSYKNYYENYYESKLNKYKAGK